MNPSRIAMNFSVGFVLFVATVVLVVGLFVVGDGLTLFTGHVVYKVRMPNAGGLLPGAGVWLGGVRVGSVEDVTFPDDSNEVEVTLSVRGAYSDRIREDSYAWIQNQGLLGDVCLYVRQGAIDKPTCAPGSLIAYKARSIVSELVGEEISTGTADLLQSLITMLQDVNKGEGTLGQLLKNPELYKNLNAFTVSMEVTVRQLQSITEEFEDILVEVREQRGTLGKLIFSEDYAKEITNAIRDTGTLLSNLQEITDTVKAGKGSLGKLIEEPELHDAGVKALDDLSRTASRLDRILAQAENSQSALGRLATDPQTGRDFANLVAKLDQASGSLAKILAIVERGEGSIGRLVHDPSLATSFRDIVLGVSEMGIVKGLARSAETAGREAYLRTADFTAEEARQVRRAQALAVLARQKEPASGGASNGEGKPVPAGAKDSSGSPAPTTFPEKDPRTAPRNDGS